MRRPVSIILVFVLALSLFCGSLAASADSGLPEAVILNSVAETDGCYKTAGSFSIDSYFSEYGDFQFTQETIILTNGSGGELRVAASGSIGFYGSGSYEFSIFGLDLEDADPGDYTGTASFSYTGYVFDDSNPDNDRADTVTGNITLTLTKEAPESSEESSEPEEPSEVEESSEIEESSETEEPSEAESESEAESSESSKTSNPGKPDELNMGGSVGASDGGKPAPDTGASYAPLAALGVAAMAGLAVIAFMKK